MDVFMDKVWIVTGSASRLGRNLRKLCSNRAIGFPIARHPRRKAFGLFGRA